MMYSDHDNKHESLNVIEAARIWILIWSLDIAVYLNRTSIINPIIDDEWMPNNVMSLWICACKSYRLVICVKLSINPEVESVKSRMITNYVALSQKLQKMITYLT